MQRWRNLLFPRDEWDAGIPSRAWGIAKHLIEETPAKNLAPAVRNGIRNEADLPRLLFY